MDKLFISALTEGERIVSHFLVQSKQLLTTKSGKPYISMILQDKTGSVSAKLWDSALEFYDTFKVNDVIKVDANAELYNKELQLVIKRLRLADPKEFDLADYLPHTDNNIDETFLELRAYAEQVANPHLKALLERFFDDQRFVKKFLKAPAARSIHHVFVGGLLEHTLSTVRLCEYLTTHYPALDADLLITMAILHDIGKIEELEALPSINYTEQGNLLGHIVIGIQMIDEKIAQISGFPPKLKMLVEHMVLSHHGQSEWGSPRPPMILEAEILHRADDLDVKVEIFTRALSDNRDPDSPWTAYQKALERILYKKPTYETDLSPEQSPG
ncbi:MAG: HD domain-containing protein [Candidatus Abyssobacteria bacterium SURF_5]|uniref:HD domain-containing protein n=1 Tax=Abyssobacteria bacterium (strain SURF_5) TaxID=2093360 RepID=A0A3A4P492_ABYX5|nr:MAG: HD domain-containing protein [Candidatus Abyssubacteria bacterium SURF_5]